MDTASCRIAAVENVKNEILPNMILDPIFKRIATIITKIKRNGSIQEVVVSVRISQIITSARPMAMAISRVMDDSRSLLDTALPAKHPRSIPTISYISSIALWVVLSESPSSNMISMTAFPSL